MGGMSGIVTGDTKEEVRKLVKIWYQEAFDKEEMYPRMDITDFADKKDFLKKGFEEVSLAGIDNPLIYIQPTNELKDIFLYNWLKLDARSKKFGCFVSAHC